MTLNKAELNLELFHETRDDLIDLAHMYNVTPSQLVTGFITFCFYEWFKIMTDDEKRRFRKHKLKRSEAKLIGKRANAPHLVNAVIEPI
jgi:hypothetical protein